MKATVAHTVNADLRRAVDDLARQIERGTGVDADEAPLVRFEVGLPAVDPLAWLAAQDADQRVYWRDRDGRAEFAACGQADSISLDSEDLIAQLKTALKRRFSGKRCVGRYFGGLCFDPRRTLNADWRPFGTARLVLPRWELTRANDRSVLACHASEHELAAGLPELASIDEVAELNEAGFHAYTLHANHTPNRDQWQREMDRLLPSLAEGPLQKLVLDRLSAIDRSIQPAAGQDISPWVVLARLRTTMSNSYLFGVSPTKGHCFLSASPERLYARSGRDIATEAVAGTRIRGRNETEDVEQERDLLGSDKDRREHGFVVRHVAERMNEVCERVEVGDSPRVMRLPRLIHRVAQFSGSLRADRDDADMLAALHPTPAVAGYPVEDALERLRTLSPVNRGWYAGPVGYVSADSAEFAVAIRSALITPERILLYAGAGIVEGSTADEEWRELNGKLGSLLEAFRG